MEHKQPTGGKSYEWVCRAADIYGVFVVELKKPIEELIEIGRTNLVRMLPLARHNEMPDWLYQESRASTVYHIESLIRELRPPKKRATDTFKTIPVVCPGCGLRHEVRI